MRHQIWTQEGGDTVQEDFMAQEGAAKLFLTSLI